MKTARMSTLIALVVLAGAARAQDGEREWAVSLLPGLRHGRETVRREAEREFVRQGIARPEVAVSVLEAAGPAAIVPLLSVLAVPSASTFTARVP